MQTPTIYNPSAQTLQCTHTQMTSRRRAPNASRFLCSNSFFSLPLYLVLHIVLHRLAECARACVSVQSCDATGKWTTTATHYTLDNWAITTTASAQTSVSTITCVANAHQPTERTNHNKRHNGRSALRLPVPAQAAQRAAAEAPLRPQVQLLQRQSARSGAAGVVGLAGATGATLAGAQSDHHRRADREHSDDADFGVVSLSGMVDRISINGLTDCFSCAVCTNSYSPDARGEPPRWACALCALGLFIYQSLDSIDGKQARRTSSQSPLGELFDHGCDSISTVFVALSACITVRLGFYPKWMFFQVSVQFVCCEFGEK